MHFFHYTYFIRDHLLPKRSTHVDQNLESESIDSPLYIFGNTEPSGHSEVLTLCSKNVSKRFMNVVKLPWSMQNDMA